MMYNFVSSYRALQFHPRNEGLWIMAASWEFDQNSNATSARGTTIYVFMYAYTFPIHEFMKVHVS
jgi:hypothetical protein